MVRNSLSGPPLVLRTLWGLGDPAKEERRGKAPPNRQRATPQEVKDAEDAPHEDIPGTPTNHSSEGGSARPLGAETAPQKGAGDAPQEDIPGTPTNYASEGGSAGPRGPHTAPRKGAEGEPPTR